MDEELRRIIEQSGKYSSFTLLDNSVQFNDLFVGQDIYVVQVHSTHIEEVVEGKKTILGFCGSFQWEDETVHPIDGDSYNERMTVYGYNWFMDGSGHRCLDILVGDDW